MTETFNSSTTTTSSDSEKDGDLQSDDEDASPLPIEPAQARASFDETEQTEHSEHSESHQLEQLQSPATPLIAMEKQGSASPRPPPLDPPPPVPPTKPQPQSITESSIGIPLQFDEAKPSRSRNRRRRRASLPAMNILPSFKSLKSVMGFGADEDGDDKADDANPSNPDPAPSEHVLNGDPAEHSDAAAPNGDSVEVEDNAALKDVGSSSNSSSSSKRRKSRKKQNEKEIKSMYVKNLKLQAEVDRVKAVNRTLSKELDEAHDSIEDLQHQIQVKQQLVQQLNTMSEQVTSSREDMALKYQQLEQRLLERDGLVEQLKAQCKALQSALQTPSSFSIATAAQGANASLSVDQYAENRTADHRKQHNRRSTMTPGGYELDADAQWTELALAQQLESANPLHGDAPHPSAPVLDDESSLDSDDPAGGSLGGARGRRERTVPRPDAGDQGQGMTLRDKLAQRPDWKELEYRGILLDDPEKSPSLQQNHRDLKKRKASIQLERTLLNRPDPQQLRQQNILKDLPAEWTSPDAVALALSAEDEHKVHFEREVSDQYDVADLDMKLGMRPNWKEMERRGILLGDPTTDDPHHLPLEERTQRKRRASQNIEMMFRNRPDVEQLAAHNIIHRAEANTAALFFSTNHGAMDGDRGGGGGGDAVYSGNVVDDFGRTVIVRNNISRSNIADKMAMKLRQRPSIDETLARGILLHRTDTKLNYNLQAAQSQLHRRRASQSLEKLMAKRPKPDEMVKKGILITNENVEAQNLHKRKRSQNLESKLRRRMSIQEVQSIGFLFTDHGLEFAPVSDSEDEHEEFIDDEEHQRNVAGLFKQKPRTSKPLQERISMDFQGVELEDTLLSNDKRRDSAEFVMTDRGRIEQMDPFMRSKRERMRRIADRLRQRPSVEEMRMRGLLLDHPTVSQQLLRRKQRLMKRRASNKLSTMLLNRPQRRELEQRNILLREDETLTERRRHKRKASQTLDSKLQRRPKLMEEKEARRQRQRSLNEHDFTPDYMKDILSNDTDDLGGALQNVDIRFLNVGGYVIPLVSPKFMSDLVGDGQSQRDSASPEAQAASGSGPGAGGASQVEALSQQLEVLESRLEDAEQELAQKEASLVRKQRDFERLKGENASLRASSSRKSLAADNSSILRLRKQRDDAVKMERLERDIAAKEEYIERLAFYLKEEENVELPTPTQLRSQRAAIANRLDLSLRRRPSAETLQQKAILSESFSVDATNQRAAVEEKQRKFGRTSQIIEGFLVRRPSVEMLMAQNGRLFEREEVALPLSPSYPTRKGPLILMEDNATKRELRQEVVRLHAMLAEKVVINEEYRRENESMKSKILESLDLETQSMAIGLKQHSLMETQVLNQMAVDLSKEADGKKIDELEQNLSHKTEQIEALQQKIRRISTVTSDHQQPPRTQSALSQQTHAEPDRQQNAIRQLLEWSRRLSWPEGVHRLLEPEHGGGRRHEDSYSLLQDVMTEQRRISKEQQRSHQEEVAALHTTIHDLRSSTQRIRVLEEELLRIRREHFEDKQRFAMNTANELDRLRSQLRNMGRAQISNLRRHQQSQPQPQNGVLSTVSALIWSSK